ncbi:Gfo/Idh/MocA family protein [Sulfuriroseicoccus oceanibius]|uniref:Gfo/Idh/MocA family oxidoreductase n=1 Tax=Sulfuriroseicoccus oceanibius TaxID=2707525 RepID=A0A6B3L7Y5_9BACT|nr:Gfo/Idh/MocA family oxidoreductase [Sulfuriroseicoccus oceanibius]QQL45392.1 Gfo/Idh/MocA family oxidoreductase [Sulfuriroseicoccus oceanibius]
MAHRILCVGAGNMGRAHALAYHHLPEFEIVGICTRSAASRESLNDELGGGYPLFDDFHAALAETRPDAVSISTYPDTHCQYALAALEAGCHVFIEKPLAESVAEAEQIVAAAKAANRKLVIGYILRHHPSWQKFIELAHDLGKPLVMRMNLNQQSSGATWETHKNLLASISPVVDCGVHYVDVMCQMTRSRPVRVSGIGARLSPDLPADKINYGQLQVTFEDGSVGWYEAGWGPMMSQAAFFVKDVVGPNGSVTIEAKSAASDDVEGHTKTTVLRRHFSELDANQQFAREDSWITTDGEPDHDGLCLREQEYFHNAIEQDVDLSDHMEDALNSMRIVAAADLSFRTGKTIDL